MSAVNEAKQVVVATQSHLGDVIIFALVFAGGGAVYLLDSPVLTFVIIAATAFFLIAAASTLLRASRLATAAPEQHREHLN